MLTPGEFVIRKDAAAAIGMPMLERLNKADKSVIADMGSKVQRFAAGGLVRSPLAVAPKSSRPELFRPKMAGDVIPNNQIGAATQGAGPTRVVNVTNNNTVQSMDPVRSAVEIVRRSEAQARDAEFLWG